MKRYDIIIVGGGVAGMQAAITAADNGLSSVILERDATIGGKVAHKHSLFPTFTPVEEVITPMMEKIEGYRGSMIDVVTLANVIAIDRERLSVSYTSSLKSAADLKVTTLDGGSIIIATGYTFFDATLKQEYGYKVYNNVITSYELEAMLKEGKIRTSDGGTPESVAFIHCVGSRDSKIKNEHCSRVCCVTGVKQAVELCESIKDIRVFNFYMDMRMFGIGYEEMYKLAQEKHQVRFIRGRVSELSQTIDNRVALKAEDTLIARPISISVDLVVLLVGMCGAEDNRKFEKEAGLTVRENGFLQPLNFFSGSTESGVEGIYYAGAIESPKNVSESINHAIAAVTNIKEYLKK